MRIYLFQQIIDILRGKKILYLGSKRYYDFIFSLGEKCFVAQKLKSANLRQFSSPFDWVLGGTFEKRFNLFLNKFECFFEKEDLIDKGSSKYRVCENKKTNMIFLHDFTLNGNFDLEYIDVSEKYKRRIKRLLDILSENKDILMVYAELPDSELNVRDIETLKMLLKKANSVYNANITLLYIKHNPKISYRNFEIKELYDNVLYTEINNYKKWKNDYPVPYNPKSINAVLERFGLKQSISDKNTD